MSAADVAEATTEYAVSLRAAGTSVTKAAKMMGVPRATLYARIQRRAHAPKTRGRRRAFEASEEASVRQWAVAEGMTKLADFQARIRTDFGKDVSLSTISRVLDRNPGSSGGSDAATSSTHVVASATELKLKTKKHATILAKVITASVVQLRTEGASLREIAKATGMPRSTLHSRLRNVGRPQKRRGRPPALDATEDASVRLWVAEHGGRDLDAVRTRLKTGFGKDVSMSTLRRILDRPTSAPQAETTPSPLSADAAERVSRGLAERADQQ